MELIDLYWKKYYNRPYSKYNIKTVLLMFKAGAYKAHVDKVRNAPDIESMTAIKQQSPGYTLSGTFTKRNAASLIDHSGYACIDVDHLDNEVEVEKGKYKSDPYTFAVFLSISGKGLKILVKVPAGLDDKTHKLYYKAIGKHYNCSKFDECAQDICRICFVTYDPDLYMNEKSLVWDQPLELLPGKNDISIEKNYHKSPSDYSGDEITDIQHCINIISSWSMGKFGKGNRNKCIYDTACSMCEYGIPIENAYDYLLGYVEQDFPDEEIKTAVDSAYGKVEFGLKKLRVENPFAWQEKVFCKPILQPNVYSAQENSVLSPSDSLIYVVGDDETAKMMSAIIPDNKWYSTGGKIPSLELFRDLPGRKVIICPRLTENAPFYQWASEIDALKKDYPCLILKVWEWWKDITVPQEDYVSGCSIYDIIKKGSLPNIS